MSRQPPFLHLFIFYLVLAIITAGFCLAALVLQANVFHNSQMPTSCHLDDIVVFAVAFPTSVFTVAHAAFLLTFALMRRLSVRVFLFSCLAAAVLWVPTVVLGWSPTQILGVDYGTFDPETDYTPGYYCYSVQGGLLAINNEYLVSSYQLTTVANVVMGMIVMTFIIMGWTLILLAVAYVYYWRTRSPGSFCFVDDRDAAAAPMVETAEGNSVLGAHLAGSGTAPSGSVEAQPAVAPVVEPAAVPVAEPGARPEATGATTEAATPAPETAAAVAAP